MRGRAYYFTTKMRHFNGILKMALKNGILNARHPGSCTCLFETLDVRTTVHNHIFMAFSEGWKSDYKNPDLAIKSVIWCIISIFRDKKSGHKNRDGHKNRGYKNRDGLYMKNNMNFQAGISSLPTAQELSKNRLLPSPSFYRTSGRDERFRQKPLHAASS